MNRTSFSAFAAPAVLLVALAFAPAAHAQRAAGGPAELRGAYTGDVAIRATPALGATASFTYGRRDRGFDGYRGGRHGSSHRAKRVWIPGRYEWRVREVVIPGATRRVWVPARFEWRYDSCGRRTQVCISSGHWDWVREPDRIEKRRERVWVEGYWRAC